MIQLLFTLIASEMLLILLFSFKTPLRKLVILAVDRMKRGRGPIMVKTVAGTVLIVLLSSLNSMVTIQKRWVDDGAVTPTDQVLMVRHLLEATLMGGSLFLALMIDRLHHYMRELHIRRKGMEVIKKQSRAMEEGKVSKSEEMKALEEERTSLQTKLKHLELELESKAKDVSASEANVVALRKQSEGLLLEYDRLVEENQNLRSQLQSVDRRLSRSGSKKNS
ncbi:B-cell receptor-associated protein 31-like [Cucurbita pepo subsp. pepo]|uniref:B-cell receptor-associated protein 31-like n=1 Tax=Cucurbita pepo subsp. pepo TaxID=3664 RepID=UPI000C9D5812|nr:B-cell receptor-associated protein 31-like [Cucurbita pepo subsp. pepo]